MGSATPLSPGPPPPPNRGNHKNTCLLIFTEFPSSSGKLSSVFYSELDQNVTLTFICFH